MVYCLNYDGIICSLHDSQYYHATITAFHNISTISIETFKQINKSFYLIFSHIFGQKIAYKVLNRDKVNKTILNLMVIIKVYCDSPTRLIKIKLTTEMK